MESYRVNKSDKIIMYSLALILLVDILVLAFSIIYVSAVIYFFSELVFITVLPAIIVYSLIITLVNKYSPNKKSTIIIAKIVGIIIYMCFIFFDKSYFFNRYLDIPNIINNRYNTIIGKPSRVSIEGTKTRTQFFEINNIMFTAETYRYRDNILKNQNYKVIYLQNSNYIISIEKQ